MRWIAKRWAPALLGPAMSLAATACGSDAGAQSTSDSQSASESSDADSDTSIQQDMAWALDTFSNISTSTQARGVFNITLNADGTVDYDRDSCTPELRQTGRFLWRVVSAEELEIYSDEPGPILGKTQEDVDTARVSRSADCDEVDLVFPAASPSPRSLYRGRHCLSEAGTSECFESWGQRCGAPPNVDCTNE